MSVNRFTKSLTVRSEEYCRRLDKKYGLMAFPWVLMVTIATIPLMIVEHFTYTMAEEEKEKAKECLHQINNKRANYRGDPRCIKCGEKLCTAREQRGVSCMLIRGHSGQHNNPYLQGPTGWSFGSTPFE